MGLTDADVKACREQAAFYRSRGFNPLPSVHDDPDGRKRPMIKYADLWETPLSEVEFQRFETPCLQVMTGRHWGLLVIDLDGPEAIERWATMGRTPRTWISHSGGGGRHVWLSIPRDGRPLSKAILWRGEGKHEAIERLCDKSLVMAPPSIHPKTGRRYKWLDRSNSPFTVPMPAPCPAWVLQLAPVVAERPLVVIHAPSTAPRRMTTGRATGPRRPWREVVESIPDIPGLVRSWGVRTVGGVRASGWISCHAIDRDDATPSAAIHSRSGFYLDSGSGLRLGLLDLAVQLGVYSTPHDAINDLGGKYGRAG
jgi:hypothetical protein